MAEPPKQTSLASRVMMLVMLAPAAAYCLFTGVHDLTNSATCDGRAMAADDTCSHYGRGGERLQSPTTTILTLPPRPTFPPAMGDDVPDVWGDLPTITATVPAGGGKSVDGQSALNRIEGTVETLFGAGLLITAIVLSALTVRGRRRKPADPGT